MTKHTHWHLIRVTPYGLDTDKGRWGEDRGGPRTLENPSAEDWRTALDGLDAQQESYPRDPDPVVLAIPTTPKSRSCPGTIGKPVTLARCPVCNQCKVPRRKHVCDRHYNPRVGDVYHRVNVFWRWIGEGSYGDNYDKEPRDCPHLFREERTTDVIEITAIEHQEAWSWEDNHYPGGARVTHTAVLHQDPRAEDRTAEASTHEDERGNLREWREHIGASYASTGRGPVWVLVTEGQGATVAEILAQIPAAA